MQRFVLTPEEKRVLIFIIAAFLLGLGAKYYRAQHSSAGPPYKADPHPASSHAPSPIAAKKQR